METKPQVNSELLPMLETISKRDSVKSYKRVDSFADLVHGPWFPAFGYIKGRKNGQASQMLLQPPAKSSKLSDREFDLVRCHRSGGAHLDVNGLRTKEKATGLKYDVDIYI